MVVLVVMSSPLVRLMSLTVGFAWSGHLNPRVEIRVDFDMDHR